MTRLYSKKKLMDIEKIQDPALKELEKDLRLEEAWERSKNYKQWKKNQDKLEEMFSKFDRKLKKLPKVSYVDPIKIQHDIDIVNLEDDLMKVDKIDRLLKSWKFLTKGKTTDFSLFTMENVL